MLKRFAKSGVQTFIHSDTQWKMNFKKQICVVFPACIWVILVSLCLSFIQQAIGVIIMINNSVSEYLGPIQGTPVPLRLTTLLLNQKTVLATEQFKTFQE